MHRLRCLRGGVQERLGDALRFREGSRTSPTCPRVKPERNERVQKMVGADGPEGFGNCSNLSQCEAVCPKEISARVIAELNRDLLRAQAKG